MRILGSDIVLASSHQSIQQHARKESLTMWVGERPSAAREDNGRRPVREADRVDRLHLSATATGMQPHKVKHAVDDDIKPGPEGELKMQILMAIYERATGRRMEIMDPAALNVSSDVPVEEIKDPKSATNAPPQKAGFGIEYDYYESHYEAESTSFSAKGVVKTADGKELAIEVNLSMTREYASEQRLSLRAGDAVVKDPLVVNFSGTAAQLTQTKYSFDLDADGRAEQISFVAPGSGFLAIDRSGDGQINNGSELFGAQSGNGFADLARYDDDGNQWIDEGDMVYDRLRVWSKDASGGDQLMALGAAGVGAIYLGHLTTPFEIKNSANVLQGQVASSGIFLSDNGLAGTVQQVNLVV